MRRKLFLAIISAGFLLTSCTLPLAVTPTAIVPTDTPFPATPTPVTPSPTATLTPTVTLTPTQTPFVPFNLVTWADNVNLRASPGYLFPVVRILEKGTKLLVLGRAPGGEWLYVRTQNDIPGWVFGQLTQSATDIQEAPIHEPQNVQVIRGQVLDVHGTPIRGVGFSVVKGTGPKAPTNTVLTDANGEFFSYMPLNSSGTWTVGYNAIACDSNVWKGTNCSSYKDEYKGNVEPPLIDVTLPHNGVLEFSWK